jgi:DNA polymerase III delta prime subunit
MSAVSTLGRTPSSKYQPGTITAVTVHQSAPGGGSEDVIRYDVSVRVRNVVYVVLFTPRNGDNIVEHSAGFEMLFLVGDKTLTFNGKGFGSVEVPILRTEILPPENGIDWSKAQSQYFSMKQRHLSEALDLTDDQQAKVKPLIEQESAEAGSILWTPVVSPKDRLKQYQKIVKSSDAKLKPLLSRTQVAKLEELRKQQKMEVKKLIAELESRQQE